MKTTRETLINLFNNAFSHGEEGEELRNPNLAEEYADEAMQLIVKEKKELLEEAFQLLKKCTSSGDYVGASDDELKMIARFRKQIAHSQEDREEK